MKWNWFVAFLCCMWQTLQIAASNDFQHADTEWYYSETAGNTSNLLVVSCVERYKKSVVYKLKDSHSK